MAKQRAFSDVDLAALSAGHAGLIAKLSAPMTDDMLSEIASADYGMGAARCHQALQQLKADDELPIGPLLEAREIFELFRWSEVGDNRTGRVARPAATFHTMRALCCAILLEVSVHPMGADHPGGQNQTLVRLLESLSHSDLPISRDAVAFSARLIERQTELGPAEKEDAAFFVVGLIAAIVRDDQQRAHGDMLTHLCRRAETLEARVYEGWGRGVGHHPDHWLLRTTFHTIGHEKWRAIGREIGDSASAYDAPAQQALQALGHALATGTPPT